MAWSLWSFPFHCLAELPKPFIDRLPVSAVSGKVIGATLTDRDQVLWYNSEGYLNRFEGERANLHSLFNGVYSSLFITLDQWNRYFSKIIKNNDYQLEYYQLSTGVKGLLTLTDKLGKPFDHIPAQLTITSSESDVWILTGEGQFYRGRLVADLQDRLVLESIELPVKIKADNGVWLKQAHDRIWLADQHHLLAYETKTGAWRDFSTQLTFPLAVHRLFFMTESDDGTAWFALYNEKKNLLKAKNQTLSATTLNNFNLYDILYDDLRQQVWVTSNNGLYALDPKTEKIRHYPTEVWQDVGLPTPLLRDLNLDQQGNLWLTSNKGILVLWALHRNVSRIVPEFDHSALRDGKASDQQTVSNDIQPDPKKILVTGLTADSRNSLWWFTPNNELIHYDQITGKEKAVTVPLSSQKDKLISISFSRPYVLLTTLRGQLLKYDIQQRRFVEPVTLLGATKWENNHFLQRESSQNDKLWFTRYEPPPGFDHKQIAPLFRFAYYDTSRQRIKEFACHFDQKNIQSKLYLSFSFTYQNTTWLLSRRDETLLMLDLAKSSCRVVQLPQKNVNPHALSQTDAHSVWIVQGEWIYILALADFKILERFPSPVANPDITLVDENGDFLIAGKNSLWRFRIKEQRFELLFASQTPFYFKSHNPYYDPSSGLFYVLTGQAIVAIDTRDPPIIPEPKIMLGSYQVDNVKSMVYDQNLASINLNYQETLRLNLFAVPVVPDTMQQFRYRSDSDQNWKILPDYQSQLMLSNLPLGESKLEVQVVYGQAKFSSTRQFTLNVKPPWWRNSVAYTIYLIIFLLLIYLLFDWLRSKDRLRNAQLMVRIFENTSEGLCVLDSQGRIVKYNQSLETMLGWDLHGNIYNLLQSIDKNGTALRRLFAIKDKQPKKGEATLTKPDLTPISVALTLDQLDRPINEGQGRYIMVVEDVTERKRHEQKLVFLAEHDYLTRLPNRLYFDQYVRRILADIERHPTDRFALVLLDLDDFKTVNDSLGHKTGDLLLIEIANALSNMIALAPYPKQSLVARHSGDEFLILLKIPHHDDESIRQWLIKLINALEYKPFIKDFELEISASAGVSLLPDNGNDPDVLLQQADMALFLAKKKGKASFAFYDASLEKALKNQLEIENALTQKLHHQGLLIYYQPKVSVRTGKIIGFEALMRWQLKSGELIHPTQFLPLIRTGKIDKLFNRAVLQQTVFDMRVLHKLNPKLKMSVNLSPKHLGDSDYITELCKIITHQAVPAQNYMFEILEDAGIDDPAVLINLDIIHNANIGISIDDFGTGYSSLSHLNMINASELKIDRSFIRHLPGDKKSEALFKNILALAKRFDLNVVCEGVETSAQLDFIRDCDCHFYQGYFFSKPVPLSQAIELLKEDIYDKTY